MIFTSRDEIFPLVLLEAQNFGLPVIAFNVNGPKEIIKEDVQGKLIEPFNIDLFYKHIDKFQLLWSKNTNNYQKNKNKIKFIINKRYNKSIIIKKLISLF